MLSRKDGSVLVIGILGYGVASIRGRGRVVPLGRVQAVPSGHPPGAACSSSVADGTSGTRTTLPSWWELGSLVQPSGDGVCNKQVLTERSWIFWFWMLLSM